MTAWPVATDRHHPERRTLPAPVRPDQRGVLVLPDPQIYSAQHLATVVARSKSDDLRKHVRLVCRKSNYTTLLSRQVHSTWE